MVIQKRAEYLGTMRERAKACTPNESIPNRHLQRIVTALDEPANVIVP